MSEYIFVTKKAFSVQAQEVIRELANRPYMLLRIAVVGPHFPYRDSTPFVRLVGDRKTVESLMAEISSDQKELRGYFPTDVKIAGRVEFGYASEVLGSLTISRLNVAKLDIKRIDPKVQRVTLRHLSPFKQRR